VVYIRLTGVEKFAVLAAQLKGPAHKTMRAELSKALRVAAKPAVDDVKATVRNLPVTGSVGGGRAQRATKSGRHRGLRAAVAAGVRTKVEFGRAEIRIVVAPSLPADQRNLPKYLNRPGGWRHPVYGHRDRWAREAGRPYFETRILGHRPGIQAEMEKALNATARAIAAAVR